MVYLYHFFGHQKTVYLLKPLVPYSPYDFSFLRPFFFAKPYYFIAEGKWDENFELYVVECCVVTFSATSHYKFLK